jgi:hypothetical protein
MNEDPYSTYYKTCAAAALQALLTRAPANIETGEILNSAIPCICRQADHIAAAMVRLHHDRMNGGPQHGIGSTK